MLAIGSTLCSSTAWISDRELHCLLSEGIGDHLTLSLYLNSTSNSTNLANTSTRDAIVSLDDAFFYDFSSIFLSELANCSSLDSLTYFEENYCSVFSFQNNVLNPLPIFQQNLPSSGKISLSVKGDNFGVYDYSPLFQISPSSAEVTRWQSNTFLVAIANPGIGNDLESNIKFQAFLDKYQGTSKTFSYNIPQLSSQVSSNSYYTSISCLHFHFLLNLIWQVILQFSFLQATWDIQIILVEYGFQAQAVALRFGFQTLRSHL